MRKSILLSTLGTAILAMSTASAGNNSLFGSSSESSLMDGVYVGASYGQATARCMLINQKNNECSTSGGKAFAGYKLTDNIAVEGAYYSVGNAKETHETASFGTVKATSEATGVSLSGIYSHKIANNLDIFGKLGAMKWNLRGEAQSSYPTVTDENNGVSLIYGAGASYQLTNNLALRGEYEHYTAEYPNDIDDLSKTKETDVDILSVGVTFATY